MKLRRDSIIECKKIKQEINQSFSPGIDKVTRSISAIVQQDARAETLIREVNPPEDYFQESSGSFMSEESSISESPSRD
jgi:hypothetical protein